MSSSKFHRNHALHISLSEQLSAEVKETGQDVLKQVSNLDQEISDQILLKVVNIITGGVFAIIPDLQEIVIKSNTEEKSNANLKDVVERLSQYCNQVMQEYNSDSTYTAMKEEFKTFVLSILHEAEDILNIIKRDDLHDFKQELENILKEILYAIHIGQVRLQIENFNQEELKDDVEGIKKECFEEISEIEHCSPEVLKSVANHLKITAKHALIYSHRVNKAASNYRNIEIQNKIIESTNKINFVIQSLLLGHENITNIKEAIEIFLTFSVDAWDTCILLFQFIDNGLENKKDADNLRDIVKWAASYGFVIHKQARDAIKYASSLA